MYFVAVHEAIANYLSKLNPSYTKEEYDDFVNRIINKDPSITEEVYKKISNDALFNFIRTFQGRNPFNNKHRYLRDLVNEGIRAVEIKDIRSVTERHYTLSTDVYKALTLPDQKHLDLLNDIVTLGNMQVLVDPDKEDTVLNSLNTDVMKTAYLLNAFIEVDRFNKKVVDTNELAYFEEEPDGSIAIYIKKSDPKAVPEKTYLLNYVLRRHVNIKTMYAIIETLRKNSTNITPAKAAQLGSKLLIEYYALVRQYGRNVVYDTIDVSRESFKGTDEEYNLLNNVGFKILYDGLNTKEILDTVKGKTRTGNIKVYLRSSIHDAWINAKKILKDPVLTMDFNGTKIQKPSTIQAIFILNVIDPLNKNIPEDVKKLFVEKIAFYQATTTKGFATQININDLKENEASHIRRINTLEGFKDKTASVQEQIKTLKSELIDIQNRIKFYENVNKNIENKKVEEPTELFNYLLNNPENLERVFFNTKGTDEYPYVIARTEENGKTIYVVIEHYALDGTSNLDESNIKGLPSYNSLIGEEIIKKNDQATTIELNKTLKTKLSESNIDPLAFSVYSSNDKYVLIVNQNGLEIDSSLKYILENSVKTRNNRQREVYIVTPQQFTDILEMSNTSKYINYFDYVAIKDPVTGKIKGKIDTNILNVKSNKGGILDGFINDLENVERLRSQQDTAGTPFKTSQEHYDYVVERLEKFAVLFKEYAIVEPGNTVALDFTKTNKFKKLYRLAKKELAFRRFNELLGYEGYNIDVIGRAFFINQYIKDGYKLDNLEADLSKLDPSLYDYLINNNIGDTTLFNKVKEALTIMQKEYKDSDIDFDNYNDIYNKELLNTIEELKDLTYKFVTKLKYIQKDLYNKIIGKLEEYFSSGLEYFITPQEISARVKILRDANTNFINGNNKYNENLTMFNTVKRTEERLYGIQRLKEMFNLKQTDGVTLETQIARSARKNRKFYKQKVKESNARIKGTSINLNWSNLLYIIKNNKNIFEFGDFKQEDLIKALSFFNIDRATVFNSLKDEDFLDIKRILISVAGSFGTYLNQPGITLEQFVAAIKALPDNEFQNLPPSYEKLYNFAKMFIDLKLNNNLDGVNKDEIIRLQEMLLKQTISTYLTKISTNARKTPAIRLGGQAFMAYQKALAEDPNTKLTLNSILADLIKKDKEAVSAWYKKPKEDFRNYTLDDPKSEGGKIVTSMSKIIEQLITVVPGLSFDNLDINKTLESIIDKLEDTMFGATNKVAVIDQDTNIPQVKYASVNEYLDSIQDPQSRNITEMFINLIFYRERKNQPTTTDIFEEYLKSYNIKIENFRTVTGALELPIDDNVYKVMANFRSKKSEDKFESPYELYSLMKIPLLNDSKDFMSYFKNFILGYTHAYGKEIEHDEITRVNKVRQFFAELGFTDYEEIVRLFEVYKTVDDLMVVLINKINGNDNAFVFVSLLNMIKSIYINQKFEGSKWSWSDAVDRFRDKEIRKNIKRVKALEATGTFETNPNKDVFENSILRGIYNSVSYLINAGTYVQDINDRLDTIVLRNEDVPDTNVTPERKYILTTPNNISKIVLQQMRDTFKVIFIPNTNPNYNATLAKTIEQALGDISFHYTSEQYAKNINEVPSRNADYTSLMQLYTKLLKLIKPDVEDINFVRFLEIAIAINNIYQRKEFITIYKKDFEKYVNLINDPEQLKNINKQIEEITNYFNSRSHLINMSPEFAKAIMGYILINKFENKTKQEAQARIKYLEKEFEIISDAQQRYNVSKLTSLANQIETAQSIKKAINIIFPKAILESMTPKERREVTARIQNINDLTKILTSQLNFDAEGRATFDTMEQGVAGDKAFDFKKLPTVVSWEIVNNTINKILDETKTLTNRIDGLKSMFNFNNTDLAAINKKELELLTQINILESSKVLLNNEIDGIKKEAEERKEKILIAVYENTPSLIKEYEEFNEKILIKAQKENKDKIEKFKNKKSVKFFELYDKTRDELIDAKLWLSTKEYKAFAKIRKTYKKDTFENNVKALVDAGINIQTVEDYNKFIKNAEDSLNKINTLERTLINGVDPKESKVSKKTWGTYRRRYESIIQDNEKRIDNINKYFTDGDTVISDTEDGLSRKQRQLSIARFHINKIQKAYYTSLKGAIKEIVKKEQQDLKDALKLDNKNTEILLKSQNEYLNKAQTYLAQAQDEYLNTFGFEDFNNYEAVIDKAIQDAKDKKEIFTFKKHDRVNEYSYRKFVWAAYVQLKVNYDLYKLGLKKKDITKERYTKEINKYANLKGFNLKGLLTLTKQLLANINKEDSNYLSSFKLKGGLNALQNKDKNLTKDQLKSLKSEFEITINNLIANQKNFDLEQTIKALTDLKGRITANKKNIENANKVITTLQTEGNQDPTAVLKRIAKQVSKETGKEISDEYLASYILSTDKSLYKKEQDELVAQKTELDKKIKALKEEQNALKDYSKNIPDRLGNLKNELEKAEKDKKDLQAQYDSLIKAREEEKPYGNSNLDTYKNLHKVDIKDTNIQVIEKIIKDAGQYYIGGYDKLLELIKKTNTDGEENIGLHNGITDTVITAFNYMKVN